MLLSELVGQLTHTVSCCISAGTRMHQVPDVMTCSCHPPPPWTLDTSSHPQQGLSQHGDSEKVGQS